MARKVDAGVRLRRTSATRPSFDLTGCQLPERQPIQRLPLLGWAALDRNTEREVLDLALNLVARRSLTAAA